MATNPGGNVGCYIGCERPVIGQCSGFGRHCGRFYCAEHSAERLCLECASAYEEAERRKEAERQRKEQERLKEEVLRVYSDTAEHLYDRGNWSSFWMPAVVCAGLIALHGCGAIGGAIMARDGASAGLGGIALIGSSLVFAAFLTGPVRRVRQVGRLKRSVNESLPGFQDFYRAYRKQRHKKEQEEAFALVVGLAVGALAAGAHISEQHKRDRLIDDVHVIRQQLGKKR